MRAYKILFSEEANLDIQKLFDISYPTASNIVNQLIKIGILEETTGQKRSKRYIYKKYMDILSYGTNL